MQKYNRIFVVIFCHHGILHCGVQYLMDFMRVVFAFFTDDINP